MAKCVKEKSKEQKEKLFKMIFKEKIYSLDYTGNEASLIRRVLWNKFPANRGRISRELWVKHTNLIRNDPEIKFMGSNTFVGSIYSVDIDMVQLVKLEKQTKAMYEIVYNIIYVKDYYYLYYFLGDIKIGYSKYKELKNYIGSYDFKTNILTGYNPQSFKNILSNIGGVPLENFKILENPTMKEWIQLYYYYHQMIVRRWTPNEILTGYQLDENNEKYTLEKAIKESDMTKIDLYGSGGGPVIIECTNILVDKNKFKKANVINNDIFQSMLTCIYVKEDYYKALKRLYNLTRKAKVIDLSLKLHKFTQKGAIPIIYYVKTGIEIGNLILQKYNSNFIYGALNTFTTIINHFQYLQTELQKIYDDKNIYVYNIIQGIDSNIINPMFNQKLDDITLLKINLFCNKSVETINKVIQKESKNFIKDNNIIFENYTNLI